MTNVEYRQHVADRHFQISIMFDKLADAEKRDNPVSRRAYSDYRKQAAKHNAIAIKNVAVLDGYTLEVEATCSEHTLFLLVRPGTDFDSTFKAWDTDNQEFIRVNGWLYSVSITSVDPDFHTQVRCDACGQMVPRWHVCQYNNASLT